MAAVWQQCSRQKLSEPLPVHTARSGRSLLVQFYHAKLVTERGLVEGELWMQHGVIVDPQERFWQRDSTAADRRIDCKGMLLAPGFIDVHLRGACGVDFTALGAARTPVEAAQRAVARVCQQLPAYGVTSFCPTVGPSDPASYRRLHSLLRPSQSEAAATLVGVHLDGPFLSGAYPNPSHDHARIRASLAGDSLATCYGPMLDDPDTTAAIVTLAPELDGGLGAVRALHAAGVVVGIGRTAANLAECEQAVMAGATLVTDMFSCMQPFHHRDPGPVGLLATDLETPRSIFYSLALDKGHAHQNTVNLAYCTNPEGLLVTSAGIAYPKEEGHHCTDRDAEADAEGALVAGVRALCNVTVNARGEGGDPSLALLCASHHPARLLGLANKGNLHPGSDADIVLLSEDLQVRATFVGGVLAWQHKEMNGAFWYYH